jgi:integrase
MPERIADYTPQMPPAHWAVIEEFVRSAVTDAKPDTTDQAADYLTNVARLVLWVWRDAGLELERSVVFNRWTIEQFIAIGCKGITAGSRGTARSRLFTVAERLLGADARLPRVAPLPSSEPARPYTPIELIQLRSWAKGQTTAAMRRNAALLLSLGAGAGLAASDINHLTVADVTAREDGVILNVTGPRPREVVMLSEWEDLLVMSIRFLPPHSLVFGTERRTYNANSINGFVAKTYGHRPHVTSQRLRATWIVHHLNAGTPLAALMIAAGVQSLEAFTRYLGYVAPMDTDNARRWLRGTANP